MIRLFKRELNFIEKLIYLRTVIPSVGTYALCCLISIHRSRVILDLFYDHFLAANFRDFQGVSLFDYVIKVSDILEKQLHLMPENAKHYFIAMRKYSWLEIYASIDGIRLVLNQMSKRKNMDPMGPSVEVLEKHYPHFRAQTHAFLHEVIAHFVVKKIGV